MAQFLRKVHIMTAKNFEMFNVQGQRTNIHATYIHGQTQIIFHPFRSMISLFDLLPIPLRVVVKEIEIFKLLCFLALICATAQQRYCRGTGICCSSVRSPQKFSQKPPSELTPNIGKATCPPHFQTILCVFVFQNFILFF